jgi:L-alanine-DL-glutamate epimerase-like enolase superfamily enzyme
MKIAAVETRALRMPLSRPYTIAFRTIAEVETTLVVLHDDAGRTGLGAATPEPHVTGETPERCRAALAGGALDFLISAELGTLPRLLEELERRTPGAPAARAAVDMALHDLLARGLGLPLGELLGQYHAALPTSITIGIKPLAETLAEADEYLGRGFRVLKVKIGRALDEDLGRLARLRERVGARVVIRADANQGYTLEETRRFFAAAEPLDIEFLEQPVKAAGVRLMWGCMDESCIGIAAALAVALASPATHYLDLDGSFDLARDVARGGFLVQDGILRPAPGPGLGVEWAG